MTVEEKFPESMKALRHALSFEQQISEDSFYYSGIAKAFEVAVEYGWKYLRMQVVDQGLEAYGPKDSVRAAASMGLIDDPQAWIDAINVRNLSVHDYITLPKLDLVGAAKEFLKLAEKIAS